MIYLHCSSLQMILADTPSHLTAIQRQRVREYRQFHLQKFCHLEQLITPEFAVHRDGKPFCVNIPQLQFNHSHSQNHYALAYSLNVKQIGVDIEDLNRQANFLGLAKRCFHVDELDFWLKNNQDKQLWLKIWTAKEAIVKAFGIGIRINLNEINTNISMNHSQGKIFHQRLGVFYYQFHVMEQSIITVAYQPLFAQHRPIIVMV